MLKFGGMHWTVSTTSKINNLTTNTHSTQQLARCAEEGKYARFNLKISHNCLCHFLGCRLSKSLLCYFHLHNSPHANKFIWSKPLPHICQFTDLHSCQRFTWLNPLTQTVWLFPQIWQRERVKLISCQHILLYYILAWKERKNRHDSILEKVKVTSWQFLRCAIAWLRNFYPLSFTVAKDDGISRHWCLCGEYQGWGE